MWVNVGECEKCAHSVCVGCVCVQYVGECELYRCIMLLQYVGEESG